MLPLIEASLKDESDEIRKIIVDLFLQVFIAVVVPSVIVILFIITFLLFLVDLLN